MSETLAIEPDVVHYPTSDGRPVAETERHFMRLVGAAYGIRKHLAGRDDVYVGSNLLVFDEPGNPRRHLSPDIFVAFGVRRGERDLFKIWEEKPPAFVLEITSASTRREDERTKRQRYAQWGVGEYFLYDPRGEWLTPPLQGLELHGRRYRKMREVALPNGERGLRSESLGLGLWLKGSEIRLYDPATGRDLPTPEEEGASREIAEARANADQQRADAAEQRADAAEQRADAAEQRAQKDILTRQAAAKFDAPTADRLAALLRGVTEPEDFLRIGEWLLLSPAGAGDELLSRVGAMVARPTANEDPGKD
ncbi:MAG: Uma2 family endonuclease [Gammaproteobacteria bacterium]|nr:Uma2 family endonuclease [Gammaproteobacteria bacterium]